MRQQLCKLKVPIMKVSCLCSSVSEAKEAQQNGRIIADKILKGALKFIEQQPFVVLGSVDRHQQNIWASILCGHPGFVKAVDQHAVEVDLSQALCNWNDPFWSIEHYSQVGALFIELASRRRLRLNGTISRTPSERLRLEVESYPTVQNIFSDDTSIFALIALHLNYLSNGRTILEGNS